MSYDIAYERAAKYALSQGAILVAAAGNHSHRSWGQYNPIDSPADCPSILAVAAVDNNLNVADFSCRGIDPNGQVDICGLGVDVYSSWIMPMRYRQISGTSMATPHVAGILALLWEKYPNYTAEQVILELLNLRSITAFLNGRIHLVKQKQPLYISQKDLVGGYSVTCKQSSRSTVFKGDDLVNLISKHNK